MATKINTFGVR